MWSKAGDAGGLGLSLPTTVQDFVTLTLSIMIEATPFVILGALVSAARRLYVPTQRIIAFLPQDGDSGFNAANDEVVFRRDTSAEVYDARTKKARELAFGEIGGSRSTPEFLSNSDSLIFTENVMDEDTGGAISRVVIASPSDERSETQVTADPSTYFYAAPKISYDDRYILASTAPASGGFDPYLTNPLPEDAWLTLYDRTKDEVLEEVRGAEPVWSR